MQKIYALVLLFLLFSSVSSADENRNSLVEPTNAVLCGPLEVELKFCRYTAKNISSSELHSRIIKFALAGTPPFGDEFVYTLGPSQVAFWLEDEAERNRVSNMIPLLDTFDEFEDSSYVMFKAQLFIVSESVLTDFDVSLSNALQALNGISIGVSLGGGLDASGTINADLGVASKVVDSLLGSAKYKNKVELVETISRPIPNRGNINYDNTTKLHFSPTPGQTGSEKAGLNASGSLTINEKNSDEIMLRGFNFRYGVVVPKDDTNGLTATVREISIRPNNIILKPGLSYRLINHTSQTISRNSTTGVLQVARGSSTETTTMMVLVSAYSISNDEYNQYVKRMQSANENGKLTKDERNNLPKGGVSLEKMLESAQPFSYRTSDNNRALGFKLSRELLTKENIDTQIEITIKGGGAKENTARTVESLATEGFSFPTFTQKYLDKPYFDIDLKLENIKGVKVKVDYTFHLNPETFEFF